MRIQKLYFLIAAVIALLLGGVACQTAQRPATLVPTAKSSAPPLNANSATTQSNAHPEAASAQKTETRVKTDPVADLIAQVEKEYELGEENYKAGHLEAGKENFDRGFNLLLSSSLDIRTDERLQQEFAALNAKLGALIAEERTQAADQPRGCDIRQPNANPIAARFWRQFSRKETMNHRLAAAGIAALAGGAGGVAIGLLVGAIVARVHRLTRTVPVVANTVSLLTPFASYLLADLVRASGILAVVATGMYAARTVPKVLGPAIRQQIAGTWTVVTFMLESLVFMLVGLELPRVMQALRTHTLRELLVMVLILWFQLEAAVDCVDRLLHVAAGEMDLGQRVKAGGVGGLEFDGALGVLQGGVEVGRRGNLRGLRSGPPQDR